MKRRLITLGRIIQTGVLNFMRNIGLAVAAVAVMVVTLTVLLLSVVINSTFSNTVAQITTKIDISVYLKDSDTTAQTNQLISQLKGLSNVASVQYLDKAQVLKQYEAQNAGNQGLALAISETSNPLPATIHVKPKNLNKISSIKSFLVEPNVAALQSNAPSYSGTLEQAINNITHATDILRELGVIAVIVFAVICVLIIFNTLQMAIFNRRDEIQIMRLLGANTSYIRGPFVVESAIYGFLAAIISVLLINSLFVTASSTLQATTLGLLNIGYATNYFDSHFWLFLTTQILIGIMIGAVSATIATRRYLKFKIK
ncbi:MAG TPA: permease-like cell division protein FtsX [Candidatus Saccharimonadales bacterium]